MSAAHDIFLSYSREDDQVARRLAEACEVEGLRVWRRDSLPPADAREEAPETEQALREAGAVVVLWSRHSAASRRVRAEASLADRERRLVPVVIEPCARPVMFEPLPAADLTHWHGDTQDARWQAFVAAVRRAREGDLMAAEAAPAKPAPPGGTRHGRRVAIAAAAVLLIAAGVFAGFSVGGQRQPAAVAGSAAEVLPPAPRTALAVAPFVTVAGSGGLSNLGDIIAVDLMDVLRAVPGLDVRSRGAAFIYSQLKADRARIVRDLRVGTVLEGRVENSADKVSITASLVDAATGKALWSGRFERELGAIFAVEEDLARAVVTALQGDLPAGAASRVVREPATRDMEAWRLYVRALQPGEQNMLPMIDEAIRRDPSFLVGHTAAANLRGFLVTAGVLPASELAAAERDARRALELKPGFGDARLALAIVYGLRGQWVEADREFAAAIDSDPNDTGARTSLVTQVLQSGGHFRRAQSLLDQNHRLVPADSSTVLLLAAQYSMMGNDSQALHFADLAVSLGWPATGTPLPQIRANAAMRAGHFDQAAAAISAGLLPGVRDSAGGSVLREVYAGLEDPLRRPVAIAAMDEFVRRIGIARIDPTFRKDLIAGYAVLGDFDRAFAFANRTLDEYAKEGIIGVAWGVLWIPELRAFRADPRFQDLMRRMKFFDYWRVHGAPDGCELQGEALRCR